MLILFLVRLALHCTADLDLINITKSWPPKSQGSHASFDMIIFSANTPRNESVVRFYLTYFRQKPVNHLWLMGFWYHADKKTTKCTTNTFKFGPDTECQCSLFACQMLASLALSYWTEKKTFFNNVAFHNSGMMIEHYNQYDHRSQQKMYIKDTEMLESTVQHVFFSNGYAFVLSQTSSWHMIHNW